MPGLLDDMRAAQAAQSRGLLSHVPAQRVTGRQAADAMQMMGLLASPIPVVGDVMGLLGDAAMYAAKPEERTLGNAALTMLGMLPFFPSALGHVKSPTLKKVFHGSPYGAVDGTPRLAPHDENGLLSFSVTRSPSVAQRYADDVTGRHGVGPGGEVAQFGLYGKSPDYMQEMGRLEKVLSKTDPSVRQRVLSQDEILEWARKRGITAFDQRGTLGLDELQVIDPSALVRMPNKSPLR